MLQHQGLNPRPTISVPSQTPTGVQGCSREGARQDWAVGAGDAHISGRFHFTDNYSLVSEMTLLPHPYPPNDLLGTPVCI